MQNVILKEDFDDLAKDYDNLCYAYYFIELADYLSVDRSAMMREIKKLKDEKKIETDGKKITILY